MGNYLFLIVFILAAAGSAAGCLRNAHFFQLNSYQYAEQLKWMRENVRKHIPHIAALLHLGVSFLGNKTAVHIFGIILYALMIPFVLPKSNSKKKIVFTARMIRLLVTSGILIAGIGQFCFTLNTELRYAFAPILFVLSAFIPMIANLVNTPIEKCVQNYYISDAKRILKSAHGLTVIGITGSFGKTSVKYFLNTLLKAKYNVLMTPASFNTPMGVVKTIRGELRPTHEVFICEMGAKKVGEIKELCDIVHPQHGIITAIGPQHLETFKSLENVIKTKFELADAVRDKGCVFLNTDDVNIRENRRDQKTVTYGSDGDCRYDVSNMRVTSKGTEFSMEFNGRKLLDLRTTLIGAHNVTNLAGAISAAMTLGVTEEQIRRQLLKITAPPHRLELRNNGKVTLIDDSYNSNPTGSKAALNALALFEDHKILITPGMVELGAKQDELNMELGRYATEVCDDIIFVGEKQAKVLIEGVKKTDYDMAHVYIASDFNKALEYAYSIKTDKHKVVLIENDLPDNYL